MITSNTVTLQCFNTRKQTVSLQSIVSEILLEGAGHDGDSKGECQCKWQDDPGRVQAYIYIRVQGDLVDRRLARAFSPAHQNPLPSVGGRVADGTDLKVCERDPGQASEPVPARNDLHFQSSLYDIRTWHFAYICARASTVARLDAAYRQYPHRHTLLFPSRFTLLSRLGRHAPEFVLARLANTLRQTLLFKPKPHRIRLDVH